MSALVSKININVDYKKEKELIRNFITNFSRYSKKNVDVPSTPRARAKKASTQQAVLEYPYLKLLKSISQGTTTSVVIELDDFLAFEGTGEIVERILSNTERYTNLFYEVIDSLTQDENIEFPGDNADPLQVIIFQRRQYNLYNENSHGEVKFPQSLVRRYHLVFAPLQSAKSYSVREVGGPNIGSYITVRGIISRVSDVKPLAVVMTLSCDTCGYEVFQEITTQTFNPINECPSEQCKKAQTKGRLYMQTRASKLIRYQEVKLQEQMDQVPMSCIPMTMKVHIIEDNVKKVNSGDSVYISGVFLPTPYTGFQALRAGLTTNTYLLAHHIHLVAKSYSDLEFSTEMLEKVKSIASNPKSYEILSSSIAPELYGLEDVKKILLLLLAGGTTKNTDDGLRVRGDINVCLMGDPGVAKSQILKQICMMSPRGVYTTGRGTSGVGLTSFVSRDPVTGEFVLEGGALVMADGGVACIDEFDKMDENDRTAIHEVMEQQTISINKAGINTTLNARTSILAAANPRSGRYNQKLRLSENVDLPPALLTRFDVLYLLLDTPSIEKDLRLSRHVTYVHTHNRHPPSEHNLEILDADTIRHYIAKCKLYNPYISKDVLSYIANSYVSLREMKTICGDVNYTCARTLLSIVRMSTALARLRWSTEVNIFDVDEALRLLESSTSSLRVNKLEKPIDPVSAIFDIIKKLSRDGTGQLIREIDMRTIKESVTGAGYLDEDLQRCFVTYHDLFMFSNNNKKLIWIGMD